MTSVTNLSDYRKRTPQPIEPNKSSQTFDKPMIDNLIKLLGDYAVCVHLPDYAAAAAEIQRRHPTLAITITEDTVWEVQGHDSAGHTVDELANHWYVDELRIQHLAENFTFTDTMLKETIAYLRTDNYASTPLGDFIASLPADVAHRISPVLTAIGSLGHTHTDHTLTLAVILCEMPVANIIAWPTFAGILPTVVTPITAGALASVAKLFAPTIIDDRDEEKDGTLLSNPYSTERFEGFTRYSFHDGHHNYYYPMITRLAPDKAQITMRGFADTLNQYGYWITWPALPMPQAADYDCLRHRIGPYTRSESLAIADRITTTMLSGRVHTIGPDDMPTELGILAAKQDRKAGRLCALLPFELQNPKMKKAALAILGETYGDNIDQP